MNELPQGFLTEDIGTIKQLIKEGLDVNAKGHYLPTGGGSEATFLHAAATYDLPKVAKLLIEKDADINAQDSQGCTPLHRVADNNSCKAAKILIEAGADLNAQMSSEWSGGTPLHSALSWNVGLGIVQLLLKSGANVEAQNKREETPLHLAVWTSLKAAKLLIEYGANVNATNDSGDTPLCCIRGDDSKIGRIDGFEAAKLLSRP